MPYCHIHIKINTTLSNVKVIVLQSEYLGAMDGTNSIEYIILKVKTRGSKIPTIYSLITDDQMVCPKFFSVPSLLCGPIIEMDIKGSMSFCCRSLKRYFINGPEE